MPRRLNQTTADYVVIALSPALVMTLVGSLVYFLLAVFYQGVFPERLHWVMTCFVFAAVLIARIAIEEGYERAAPFAIGLAIPVGIAANRFAEVQGTWIDQFGFLLNWGLIGVIWWCAHQLTWDCTVIDESADSSGVGLLQTAGLERSGEPNPATTARRDDVPLEFDVPVEGTTVRSNMPVGWWQQYVERQRRPHAPGVWVVYFSLAALPLFGFGQWFIPASDAGQRRYTFWLLCVYAASGMGLLLTTSFLGLRRYLRQRRIEMPSTMAQLWLGLGAGIIVLLLLVAALLPRPGAEYAVARLPFVLGSPGSAASRMAPAAKEGTESETPGPAASDKPPEETGKQRPPGGAAPETQGKAGADAEPKEDATEEDGHAAADQQAQGNSDANSKQSPKSGDSKSTKSSEKSPSDNRPAKSNQPNSQHQPRQKTSPSTQSKTELPQKSPDESKDKASDPSAAENNDRQHEKSQEPNQAEPTDSQPATQVPSQPWQPELPQAPLDMLGESLKLAVYALVVCALLVGLWKYWQQVLAGLRAFLAELSQFWKNLWGGQRRTRGNAGETGPMELPPAPFSSYADPFASGIAARYSLEELVRYSFEAFEAWSRDHGHARGLDQTPHELVRQMSKHHGYIAVDARHLAELHARAAYDKEALPPATAEQLAGLWRQMRAHMPLSAVASLDFHT